MLVRDYQQFQLLQDVADALFFKNKEYPEYIFKRHYLHYYTMESSVAVEFEFLQSLAEFCGDDNISLVHFHPAGEGFWLKHYGHYGAITAKAGIAGNEWNSDLVEDTIGDYMRLYSADGKAVIFGNMGEWCIFREYSFDLAVLGATFDLSRVKETSLTQYVHDADWAVDYWKSSASRMDEAFYETFRANYSGSRRRPEV